MKRLFALAASLALAACAGMSPDPQAPKVKITPLGSHAGEFCPLDRALVFEDPDGTRILYDPGRTVRGPNDERLGRIDAALLSHVHVDHLGDLIPPSPNAGTCGKPQFSVDVTPNSNLKSLGGDPAKLVRLVRFGAQTMVGKVMVASVPAVHANGLPPVFLPKEQAQTLNATGLTAYVGPPGGFVLRFSNGLTAYLSGDTGPASPPSRSS
jgi:L-ascorbate metabolism protein UlaG (beta-lactamase superfamily)